MSFLFLLILGFIDNRPLFAQSPIDSIFPVRGFCIAAPKAAKLDSFIHFIREELAPRKVNTLILRVDFNYQFQSHPELSDSLALTKAMVGELVKACRESGIRLIPQINLLGHQSWAGKLNNLLRVYPEFDETPMVKMPVKYVWPNPDSLYCKSYCPLHPGVHRVVFDLVDEITDAFESNAFHAGMDEVFYIGHDQCVRCRGRNRAALFAGEVNRIRDHLAERKKELWIWGDRLLDGKTTGLGMWEASFNDTHYAVDSIARDVVICDWHYERADKTAVYFAMKGFRVITCPWRDPEIAVTQARDMFSFRNSATPEMKNRYLGLMQTVWSGTDDFLRGYYGLLPDGGTGANTPWNCFRKLYEEMLRAHQ